MTEWKKRGNQMCLKTECPVNIEFARHLLQSVGERNFAVLIVKYLQYTVGERV